MREILSKLQESLRSAKKNGGKILDILRKPNDFSWADTSVVGIIAGGAIGLFGGMGIAAAAGFLVLPAAGAIIGASLLPGAISGVVGGTAATILSGIAGFALGTVANALTISKGKTVKTVITPNEDKDILDAELIREGEYGVAVGLDHKPRPASIERTVTTRTRAYQPIVKLCKTFGGVAGGIGGAVIGLGTGVGIKLIGIAAEFTKQAIGKSSNDESVQEQTPRRLTGPETGNSDPRPK